MDRPSRDDVLMEVAESFGRRSTCPSAHVGCVVSIDGRPVVASYNGAPAGMPHCDHPPRTSDRVSVGAPTCETAVHAEANAVAWAARHGIRLFGGTLYTTYTPCLPCAKLLINAGIVRVVALKSYRDPSGSYLLEKAGITVVMLGD